MSFIFTDSFTATLRLINSVVFDICTDQRLFTDWIRGDCDILDGFGCSSGRFRLLRFLLIPRQLSNYVASIRRGVSSPCLLEWATIFAFINLLILLRLIWFWDGLSGCIYFLNRSVVISILFQQHHSRTTIIFITFLVNYFSIVFLLIIRCLFDDFCSLLLLIIIAIWNFIVLDGECKRNLTRSENCIGSLHVSLISTGSFKSVIAEIFLVNSSCVLIFSFVCDFAHFLYTNDRLTDQRPLISHLSAICETIATTTITLASLLLLQTSRFYVIQGRTAQIISILMAFTTM